MRVYSFNCSCTACNLTGGPLIASDSRRTRFGRLFKAVLEEMLMIVNPARAIQHCRDMLCLLEEEGEEDMKPTRS
jgi:hypothetical protein